MATETSPSQELRLHRPSPGTNRESPHIGQVSVAPSLESVPRAGSCPIHCPSRGATSHGELGSSPEPAKLNQWP